MPSAEIITIGTEILLGEIQDTNTAFIARRLKDIGIDLFRTHTIGDNVLRISQTIRESLQRADIIITTGGLGPTVDDLTREAIAQAINKPLEFHPELWVEICGYFEKIGRTASDNNLSQSYFPSTAVPIHNPVGTAPGFYVISGESIIFCLPGVPREMEYLLTLNVIPFIKQHYHHHQVLITRLLHVAGMGESQVDSLIGEFERFSNPTVGLMARPGQIDIRIAAKAGSTKIAEIMIAAVERKIRKLLKESIYGVDGESILLAIKYLWHYSAPIGLVEAGLDEGLSHLLNTEGISTTEYHQEVPLGPQELKAQILEKQKEWQLDFMVGYSFSQSEGISSLDFVIYDHDLYNLHNRKFAGPSENAPLWAINMTLDLLRRHLLISQKKRIND
ncbi:MAG: hypothetical protein C0391_01070 [Anaerolinea sp.]|nr:hypothetical protein [Anaerolinea sp.]